MGFVTVRPYTEISEFENLLLEESWVRGIEVRHGTLCLQLDLVLTVGHPGFTPPASGELFCYRTGEISFSGMTCLSWSEQVIRPATDAAGEIDFGHIDVFEWDSEEFRLRGDFGHINLRARNVSVRLTRLE